MDEALTIARQIAEALEAAHDQDIVHRDLKPANIKLRPDGTVKVLDFGLAKALEPASTTTSPASVTNSPTLTTPLGVTGVGVLLGTAAYMAPEQAAGRPADKRSDVWSFGVVVWEMLTGRRLFEGESVSHTLADELRAPIPFDALPADTPPAMHRLLHRCLERDRKRRLRDMGDARIEIDEAISAPRDDGRRPPPMVTSRLRQSLVLASAIAVSGLVTAGAMAWVMRERLASPAAPMRFQIPPPENADVLFGAMQLSPDGRLLAFSARGPDGVSSLWIRSLDSLEARPLEGTETTLASFFWSPDSRQLAFGTGWSGRLKKIDVSGGPAQTLCEIRSGSAVAGGSWNRDGVIIFGDPNGGPLVRVSASGGQCTALTRVDGIGQHIFPVFLPDGQHFLYLVSSFEPAPEVRTSDVYLGSLSEDPGRQQLKKILSTDYEVTYAPTERPGIGRLLFLREGTLFAQDFDNRRFELTGQAVPIVSDVGTTYNKAFVTVSSNGHLVYQTSASNNFGLAWLDRQGQVLGRVGDPLFPRTLAITKDGRHAAYESYAGGLMLIDLERGTTTRLAPGSGTGFAWSPDGTRVFVANDGLNLNLSLLSANGAKNAERLLELDELMWPLDWSGDDRFLLYRIDNAKTKGDLWALPLDGDKKPFPVVQTADDERDG
jgi:Tol biopolymer transport system component